MVSKDRALVTLGCCLVVSWIKFGVILLSSVSLVVAAVKIPETDLPLRQLAAWEANPTVRVCSNAPISRNRVEESLQFWRDLGYEFGSIIYGDHTDWCYGDSYLGSIVIMPNQTPFNSKILAQTKRIAYNKLIVGAKIEIRSDSYERPLLLEHELGHALGWPHHNVRGHIMHKTLPLSGPNSFGLKSS